MCIARTFIHAHPGRKVTETMGKAPWESMEGQDSCDAQRGVGNSYSNKEKNGKIQFGKPFWKYDSRQA